MTVNADSTIQKILSGKHSKPMANPLYENTELLQAIYADLENQLAIINDAQERIHNLTAVLTNFAKLKTEWYYCQTCGKLVPIETTAHLISGGYAFCLLHESEGQKFWESVIEEANQMTTNSQLTY